MARSNPRGFTFVEILAAMLFMAIVIPAAYQAVLLANRVNTAAARKRTAAELADRVLSTALATGEWRTGDQAGDFADEQPGYRWEVAATDWELDSAQQVTARVFYKVQEEERVVELSSLAPTDAPETEPGTS